MTEDVYVIGVSMTPFGRMLDSSIKQLSNAAVTAALTNARQSDLRTVGGSDSCCRSAGVEAEGANSFPCGRLINFSVDSAESVTTHLSVRTLQPDLHRPIVRHVTTQTPPTQSRQSAALLLRAGG